MKYFFSVLLLLTTLSGCATYNPKKNSYRDPAQNFNRVMFNFNYYFLDPYIARPAAIFWRDYVPRPVSMGLINVSSNLAEPASMVNYLLQGEGKKAAVHFTRFFLNTIFGLAGLIDVASIADSELKKPPERKFGDVLGHYGVGYGPYVVLPFYGSATLRNDGGQFADYLYLPLNMLTTKITVARWIFDSLENRAQLLNLEDIIQSSDDPYEFVRQTYFQRHDFLANDSAIDSDREQKRFESIGDYIDEIDEDD